MDKQYQPTLTEVQDWVLKLYNTCEQTITKAERLEQHKYAVMVQRPQDKKFLVKMLDESSQIRDRKKLATRIKTLIDRYGVPEFLNKRDTFLFKIYQAFGHHFDFIAIPIIKKRLRMDTSKVILDEARPKLTRHLSERAQQKVGQNVNLLGEVVLGNGEADHRYHHYLEALEAPDINYISVKISGIYAQTHALNYEESFPELVKRMSALYQKAIDFPHTDENGVKRAKFVNLDMEEYKDSHFTLRLFKTVLSKPEFKDYSAGIVVQAYLPDAYDFQTELLEFAKARVAEGGAPLKMRLVKGCNLEMETVISSLRGWPNPILSTKTEVDANYLHILERALLPENAKVLHIGVASHNLFTIAYAYLLSQKNVALPKIGGHNSDSRNQTDLNQNSDTVEYKGEIYKYNNHLSNYLFLGIDTREAVDTYQSQADAGQADAIFLVSMDRATEKIKVLFIPRDSMTRIEVFNPYGQSLGETTDHLNIQYAFGDGKEKSCELMKTAVSDMLDGLPIQGYCSMNMDGISVITDFVGGIQLTIPDDSLADVNSEYKKGAVVDITGETAEQFVRYRDIDKTQSALVRQERQKTFLQALVQKAQEKAGEDAGFVTGLYDSVKSYTVTNMGNDIFAKLLAASQNGITDTETVPGEGTHGENFDEYHIDEDALSDLIISMFYEKI